MVTAERPTTGRITLRILMDHMVHMEQRLSGQIQTVDKKLAGVEERLTKQIDTLDHRLDGVERRLSRQIASLDERLDDIEIKQLPIVKKALGIR